MISGTFGDEGELFFEIDLIAADGLELPVDALFDTGFSSWLAINDQDLEALGWFYVEQQTMRTAQGESDFEIYLGKVRIDGQAFNIPIHVGQGLSEVLRFPSVVKNSAVGSGYTFRSVDARRMNCQ